MQTIIHCYHFNTSNKEEKTAYDKLRCKLTAQGMKCFVSFGGNSHYMGGLDGKTLTLETEFLFNNQWNTAPLEEGKNGYRVFDWAEDSRYCFGGRNGNPNIKQGHYLEQTAEMYEIRKATLKCGYCGKQEPASAGLSFCIHCTDSPYLKIDELKLTRLRPIDQTDKGFLPLTDEERQRLEPIYIAVQTTAKTERAKNQLMKMRQSTAAKYATAIKNAEVEHSGFMWLLESGLSPNIIDNCIYYSNQLFCFGWRSPLSKEQEGAVLDVITEFPYLYEIKTADGRKLGNAA